MKNVNKAFLDIKKDDFTSTYYNDSKRYNDLKTIKKEIKDKETLFNLKLNSLNLNHNTFIDKSTKSGISKVFRNFIIKFLYNFSYRQNDFNKQTLELVNKNNEILTSIKKLIFYYDEEIGVL
ncbi:MAG: hypothetical protein WCO33_05360, partial [bacterium]